MDLDDRLAALENDIFDLDLNYVVPDPHEKNRHLKQVPPEEESKAHGGEQRPLEELQLLRRVTSTNTTTNIDSKQKMIQCAKSAIKQKFDRLGQLIADKSCQSASELLQTEQFNQALASLHPIDQDPSQRNDQELRSMHEKLESLLQQDGDVGLYLMPGIGDFEFDSDAEAMDLDEADDDA